MANLDTIVPSCGQLRAPGGGAADDDSYDVDLEWILARLSERGGASFGVIVRFVAGEERFLVLARQAPGLDLPREAVELLCAALRPRPAQFQHRAAPEGLQKLTLDLRSCALAPLRVLHLRFAPAPGVIVVAAICRPESSFSLLHDLVATRLQPVLERYVKLWWLHRTERRRASVFQRTIDDSELGMGLLDRQCNLHYANRSLATHLDRHDGLRRNGAGLAPVKCEEAPRFQRTLHQVSVGSASALLTVSRTNRRALIVSAVPVDRPPIDPADTAIVLHVLDPEHDVSALLEPAYRIYRLTSAEARLVSQLVSGADLAAAALSMNLALHTARSYLKQVFAKTATNRQAELVRIMCGSAARAALAGDLKLL